MKQNSLVLAVILVCITIAGCSLFSNMGKPAINNDEIVKGPQATEPLLENAPTSSAEGTLGWYVMRNKNHTTPTIDHNLGFNLADYQAFYVGSRDKLVFLTFDEGYENGYTAPILDTLKKAQVSAAFFVTLPYIRDNPALIKRMVDEGHLVANHSKTHPSMPSITDNPERFKNELVETAKAFTDLTGKDMPPFFRPPKGEYNKTSLKMTADLGYKTIFWSFAYEDWVTDRQPDPERAHQLIMQNIHPGEIMLLHAVSKTNSEILDRVISGVQEEGYRFATLLQLEEVR